MITVHLRGGLGNQLFQLTAGTHYAVKFDTSLRLDDSAIIRHKDKRRRSWLRMIDVQNIFANTRIDWIRISTAYLNGSRFGNSFSKFDLLEESQLRELIKPPRNIHVRDWFQSKDYLPKEKMKLENGDFSNVREFALELIREKTQQSDATAIHIRLGDFKKTEWGMLTPSWYQRALRKISQIGITKVDCFSDDIAEAIILLEPLRANIKFNFIEANNELLPHELLLLMSKYKYFVSSNSTLSWWACYFNSRQESEIFCPWGKELMLSKWKKISAF